MSELSDDDPRVLGEYRLSRRLGQGGQGVVYLGHSPDGTQVAIKLLHAALSDDPDVRRRFLGEIEAVRRVAAFCTAQVIGADLEGDRPYLVSEYVEGPSLREHVEAQGPRTGGSLDRLAIGTATALGAIHRAGVVHRDFKPGNVLLGLDGPRVIDFGVSRLVDSAVTNSLNPVGTPAYMAPERLSGEPAGPPADMWAWGLTVAYTATGRHAYTGGTYQEVLARILYGKPDLGELSGRLREIVEDCLVPEPAERPDAEEVLRRLLGQDAVEDGDLLSSGALAAVSAPSAEPASPPVGTSGLRTGWSVSPTRPASARRDAAGRALIAALGPGTGDPGPIEDPDPTTSFPAVVRPVARRRRVRVWQIVVAVLGVVMAVAGFVFWSRGAQGPGLEGTWTGSAEHHTANRVFPVELRLHSDGGAMRWGADLHCSGRVGRTGSGMVFTLRQVSGEECYPGTLRMFPTDDSNQLGFNVIRDGQDEVTYSGTVARTS
ncbi:serine/threonine-protein kinase [Nonomuraea jiangxiensis]|uniref:Serine/threonine protein kinase n=1 Tax=Nonomuraea jiangxiensis TaxID=633440 RepID=A0A1G9TCX2_9ACTN|nr:serine/threonine-protein kinase [Nonomuraea jiangxiensis]SDM45464.1 Serine/threonine protein kinase [Nonomuraea jiangxiensis]